MYSTLFNAVVFAVASLHCTLIPGQDVRELKERCEKILADSVNELSRQPKSAAGALFRARLVPLDLVREPLTKGLASDDIQTRFIAAEVLWQKSPMEFQQAIEDSLKSLQLEASTDIVRRAVILGHLGDKDAKQQIEHWAEHRFDKLELDDWVCPMMCIDPAKHAGKCTVCKMDLQKQMRTPNHDDWAAKINAIRAVQENGDKVSELTRSIVTSDASAFVRLQAAGLWAKEDPNAALPHIEIYLNSRNQYFAVSLLVEHFPKNFVDQFRQVIENPKQDWVTKFEAYHGLMKAGKTEYLKEFREWVEQLTTTKHEENDKWMAIYLLGQYGTQKDIARLEKLLDTDFKIVAAESILAALSKRRK